MLSVASIMGAYAQQNSSATDESTKPFYKFYKGSVATELNFSLLSINMNSTGPFTMPELRLRVGLNDKFALRVHVGLNFGHNKIQRSLDEEVGGGWWKDVVTGEITERNNFTKFSFAPGFEYHFGKWNRLSIYVGCEIPFGFYMTKSFIDENYVLEEFERDNYNGNFQLIRTTKATSYLETKNCTSVYVCDPWGCHYTYKQTGSMFFGLNAFAGFDFYVYKGLYVGAELGLGYSYAMALKGKVTGNATVTTTSVNQTHTYTTDIDEKFEDKITSGNFNFKCNPMIRLGWRF